MDEPRRYFVRRDEEQLGPLSLEEVRVRWLKGELQTDDPAWHAGLTDWATLRHVLQPEKFPATAVPPQKGRARPVWAGWIGPVLAGTLLGIVVLGLIYQGTDQILYRREHGYFRNSPEEAEARKRGVEDQTPVPGMQRFVVGKVSGWAPGAIENTGDAPPISAEGSTFVSKKVQAQDFEMKVVLSQTKEGFSDWSADDLVNVMLDGMGASGMPHVLETGTIAGYEVKRATVSLRDRVQNRDVVVDMIIRIRGKHAETVILKTLAESPQAQEWAAKTLERLWFQQ